MKSIETKKVLANSLKKLMTITPLNKITINNIVNDCNLNRQTFYYHFQDIYSLVEWIYKTEAIEGISNYRNYENWSLGFYKIFTYIQTNREFCYNILNSLGRSHLDTYLFSSIKDLLMGVIDEISVDINVDISDKEFIADFYTHAFCGLVIQWMNEGMKEDPKILIEKLKYLIEGSFSRALNKYKVIKK